MSFGKQLAFLGQALFIITFFLFFNALPVLRAQAQGQKHTNIWYFGNRAGLDFNSGAPTVLTNSAMNASEGTSSIADSEGRLLFYSDGTTVWNKQHQVMSNGTGLLGHTNSAQSCLIVQNPGNAHIYYLFTTDANGGPNGLRYSTIDMTKAGGLGAVTEKNTLLYTPTSEKLTATLHQNKHDIWVVSHEHGTNNFKSFLITDEGVAVSIKSVTTQVLNTNFPVATEPTDAIGCMKLSPDGTRIAVTHRATNTVRLFAFDAEGAYLRGAFPGWSDVATLNTGEAPYGVEFSPDNKKLYVSIEGGTKIIQYDLTSNDKDVINASRIVIAQVTLDTPTRYVGGSLQLAPDGRIYLAKPSSDYLGVIKNPNATGAAVNYADKEIHLNGRISGMGLPAFVQSSFQYTNEIKFSQHCFGQETSFSFDTNPSTEAAFIEWNFGDPASGANNTANTLNANHTFSAPGVYTVTFTRHIDNKEEVYSTTVIIKAPPVVDLGPDRTTCLGSPVTFDATTPGATYLWSNGSTDATLTTDVHGTYWVEVTVEGCTTRDEVNLTSNHLPHVDLGPDRELCQGDALVLNAFNENSTYRWQDGSTGSSFKVTAAGTYRVEVTNEFGCTISDEINIAYIALPVVDLGPDKDICANTTITLNATQTGMTYKWHNGSTAPTFVVNEPGKFWVTLTNSKGCSATDTVRVNHLSLPEVNLGRDTTLCTNETLLLNATFPNSTYLWQDGSTAPTFLVAEPGRYWVDVTNEFGCVVRDEIWVPYLTRPAINLGNDTTLCYGDTLIVGTELPGGVRYEWQDGSTNATFAITKPGTYKLKAFNQHCEASDEITVRFKDCIGGLFIPNIITPNGDGKNDVFFVHGLIEDDWELVILNRQGKEVYRTKNYKNDWAPNSRSVTGNFFYLLQHPATGRSYKGWLEVIF